MELLLKRTLYYDTSESELLFKQKTFWVMTQPHLLMPKEKSELLFKQKHSELSLTLIYYWTKLLFTQICNCLVHIYKCTFCCWILLCIFQKKKKNLFSCPFSLIFCMHSKCFVCMFQCKLCEDMSKRKRLNDQAIKLPVND